MKLGFLGTSAFAVPALDALIAAGHDIVAAYTRAPSRPVAASASSGTPVHEVADRAGIAVRTPRTLRNDEAAAAFRALDLDAAVVGRTATSCPRPSSRRRYSAASISTARCCRAGVVRRRSIAPSSPATRAGVTIIRMDEGLDTGPMLLAESVPIRPPTPRPAPARSAGGAGRTADRLALDGLVGGSLQAVPQPAEGVTYAHKLGREEAALDWRRPAAELERQVRAFEPWPGASFDAPAPGGGIERIKLRGAALALASGTPGGQDRARWRARSGLRRRRPAPDLPCSGRARRRSMAAAFARGFPLMAGPCWRRPRSCRCRQHNDALR